MMSYSNHLRPQSIFIISSGKVFGEEIYRSLFNVKNTVRRVMLSIYASLCTHSRVLTIECRFDNIDNYVFKRKKSNSLLKLLNERPLEFFLSVEVSVECHQNAHKVKVYFAYIEKLFGFVEIQKRYVGMLHTSGSIY